MLKLTLQYFGHLIQRTDSLEKTLTLGKIEGRKRGQQRMRWLDGIIDLMDMSEQTLGNSEGQGSLACCSPRGHKDSDTTEWSTASKTHVNIGWRVFCETLALRLNLFISRWRSDAGSRHTRSHPWQGHEEKTWQARRIRFSGIPKSCPSAHLKDDVCLSDAYLNRLLPNFCNTGRRPAPISSQIRI